LWVFTSHGQTAIRPSRLRSLLLAAPRTKYSHCPRHQCESANCQGGINLGRRVEHNRRMSRLCYAKRKAGKKKCKPQPIPLHRVSSPGQ
jgi:hypothetical protein